MGPRRQLGAHVPMAPGHIGQSDPGGFFFLLLPLATPNFIEMKADRCGRCVLRRKSVSN